MPLARNRQPGAGSAASAATLIAGRDLYLGPDGNDANSGLTPDAAVLTRAGLAALLTTPGDTGWVAYDPLGYVSDTSAFTFAASGDIANPITLRGLKGPNGDPAFFTGLLTVAGPWTDQGSNRWTATVPDGTGRQSRSLFKNGRRPVRKESTTAGGGDVNAWGKWMHEGTTLHVYSLADPSTVWPLIQIPNVDQVIDGNAKDYINILDLEVRGSYRTGGPFRLESGLGGLFDSLVAAWCGGSAYRIGRQHCMVSRCSAHDIGRGINDGGEHFIIVDYPGDDITISNCWNYRCGEDFCQAQGNEVPVFAGTVHILNGKGHRNGEQGGIDVKGCEAIYVIGGDFRSNSSSTITAQMFAKTIYLEDVLAQSFGASAYAVNIQEGRADGTGGAKLISKRGVYGSPRATTAAGGLQFKELDAPQFAATRTNGSPNLTGIPTVLADSVVAQMTAGRAISGSGITALTIVSYDEAAGTMVMSGNASSSGTGSVTLGGGATNPGPAHQLYGDLIVANLNNASAGVLSQSHGTGCDFEHITVLNLHASGGRAYLMVDRGADEPISCAKIESSVFQVAGTGTPFRKNGDNDWNSIASALRIGLRNSNGTAIATIVNASAAAINYTSAQIVSVPVTVTGATAANPVVITATAHGFSNTNVVNISGVVGMTQLNGNTYTVANAAANTFELSGIDGTAFTPYVSGGSATLGFANIGGANSRATTTTLLPAPLTVMSITRSGSPWVTGTVYDLGDIVSQSGAFYLCMIAHTAAAAFATDLAAIKWVATTGPDMTSKVVCAAAHLLLRTGEPVIISDSLLFAATLTTGLNTASAVTASDARLAFDNLVTGTGIIVTDNDEESGLGTDPLNDTYIETFNDAGDTLSFNRKAIATGAQTLTGWSQYDGIWRIILITGSTVAFRIELLPGMAPANETVQSVAATADITTETFTSTAHGLPNTEQIQFNAGTLPTGVSLNTTYFIVGAAANTFQVSLTSGGAAIALSGSNGSGITWRRMTIMQALRMDFAAPSGFKDLGNQTNVVRGVDHTVFPATRPLGAFPEAQAS